MVSIIFQTVFLLSIIGSIISIPLILLKKNLLKQYEGRWYYYIWVIALLTFIIPIGYVFQYPSGEPFISGIGAHGVVDGNILIDAHIQAIIKTVLSIIRNQSIGSLWLCGMMCSLSYHAFAYGSYIRKIKRKSVFITNSEIKSALHDKLGRLRVNAKIGLLSCDEINTPMMYGFFKPAIVLPTAVLDFSLSDIELMIDHELVHYKNNDILYKRFVQFTKAVHWFNPLIYVVAETINESCEYACDYDITKGRDKAFAVHYAHMIVNTMQASISGVQPISNLTVGLLRSKKNIRWRFELIMMKNNKKKAGITAAILAVVLCVSALTTVAASSVLGKSIVGQVKLQLETGEVVEPNVEYQIQEDENATQMTITEIGDSKPLAEMEIPTVKIHLPEEDAPNVEVDYEVTDTNINPQLTITEIK